jgi:small subunit ribosomal protein S16
MAVHIRLARAGTKKKPFYRVVVTDQRSPRGGRFLENIGTFDPLLEAKTAKTAAASATAEKPVSLHLDHARLDYWTSKGATPSETLARLLKRQAHAAKAAEAAAAKK